MEIREILPSDDRRELSRIYEESWKSAYRGIIPQAYLDSIPEGRWAGALERFDHTLVLAEGGRLIGTTSFGKAREHIFAGAGEIVSLYLLPDCVGKGYGRALLHTAVRVLAELNFREIYLWVLAENFRAIRFYERQGFVCCGIRENEIGGKHLHELRYRLTETKYTDIILEIKNKEATL